MKIDANNVYYKDLNSLIANSADKTIEIDRVCGQRYIGAALSGYHITINGTPGNALAAYMGDSVITVNGNAQDAACDTMSEGRVVIHGDCGDTLGYAMRGGEVFIQGNTGYRTGIHMKAYQELRPVVVVGGKAGDFLGEYLAGGIILVLGLGVRGIPVGDFCGTGMHGGVIYLRSGEAPVGLPKQVRVDPADEADLEAIRGYVKLYCGFFGGSTDEIMASDFIRLTPNSQNPYKQLYTRN